MSLTLDHDPQLASRPAVTGTPFALRLAGVVGLGGVFYVHQLGLSDKLSEVKYLGYGYIGLMIGCVIVAAGLLLGNAKQQRMAWTAAAGLCAATIIGFVLTRTTGLPQSSDDIGNWSEPAGIWSLIAEGAVVVLAARALRPMLRRA